MKILLLTPIHRGYNSKSVKKIYGIPESQGQASWVGALETLRHTVHVFRYTDSVIVPNGIQSIVFSFFEERYPIFTGRIRRKLERYYRYNPDVFLKSLRFKAVAKNYKPDLIIISGGITSVLPSSIKKIKNSFKSKVLLFSGINPRISSTQLERDLIKEKIIDLIIENDKGYAENWGKLGVKTKVLPISSVDPRKHRKIHLTKQEQEEYGSDVCFVGSITQDRIKKLEHFIGFYFKFWGDVKSGVEIPSTLKPFYQGTASGEKMIRIFNAAKIVLNFQPADMTAGGNMRTFEISGSGAFQLADRIDSKWFINKKEVVLFSDLKDAVKKIKYYLKHEKKRKTIGERGFQRAHRDHTYAKRFKNLLDIKE